MSTKQWKIEKYARFLQQANTSFSQASFSQGGKWQIQSSTEEKGLVISLNQPLNLVLFYGDEVLESINLISSSKWVKAMARNDSMLFMCRFENKVRRFRIKFSSILQMTSLEVCNDFISNVAKYMHIQVMEQDSQGFNGNANKETITIKDVVQDVLSGDQTSLLPSYYQNTNVFNQEEAETSSLIKTCLLDPKFPSFVESVEKTLKEMMDVS